MISCRIFNENRVRSKYNFLKQNEIVLIQILFYIERCAISEKIENTYLSVVNYKRVDMVCLRSPYSLLYKLVCVKIEKKHWNSEFLNNMYGRHQGYIVTSRTHTNTCITMLFSSEFSTDLITLLGMLWFDLVWRSRRHKSLNFVQRHIFCDIYFSVN